MDAEFQLGMIIKFQRWMMVMVDWNVHSKKVKMANFMLCLFCHNKKLVGSIFPKFLLTCLYFQPPIYSTNTYHPKKGREKKDIIKFKDKLSRIYSPQNRWPMTMYTRNYLLCQSKEGESELKKTTPT